MSGEEPETKNASPSEAYRELRNVCFTSRDPIRPCAGRPWTGRT